MKYRRLGGTGLEVSVIGLGCGGFGGIGSATELIGRGEEEAAAFTIMDRAFELGINYFDTANSYGGGASEEIVGRWLRLRGHRPQIVLSTKVFNRMGPEPDDAGLSRAAILKQIDASLRRLQTDHVDLYVTHEMDSSVPVEETLEALAEVVRAGKARHAGCSNVTGHHLKGALSAAADRRLPGYEAVQNGYSLLDRQAESEVLPTVAGRELGFTAYSPLAGGWLTGKYRRGEPAPAGSRMTLRPDPYLQLQGDHTFTALDRLAAAAAARGVPMGALALAWVAGHPAVSSALAGPRGLSQFAPLEVAPSIRLSQEERAELGGLMAPPSG